MRFRETPDLTARPALLEWFHSAKEGPMKVVCAWCQQAGHGVVLHEKEPYDDVISHGICDEHVTFVMAEARRTQPSASALDRRAL